MDTENKEEYKLPEDLSGREYRYQKDYSLGSTMYHVRCDDWKEFTEACKNVDALIKVIPVVDSTSKPAFVDHTTTVVAGSCKTCGAPTLPEKRITGKDGRSWWVQDCTTGDKTHKGPIRPAS